MFAPPLKELVVIKLKSLCKAFSVGFVASLAVALGPLQALAAKDMRIPCLVAPGGQSPGTQLSNGCGFPDSSDFRAHNISTLNVHFQNSNSTGTSTPSARACITYFNALGGACGSSSSVSLAAGTAGGVGLSLSQWTSGNVGHFKTIDYTTATPVQVQGIFAYIP